MLRSRLVLTFLAFALVIVATPAKAVDDPRIIDVLFLDEDGDALRIVPKGEIVTIRAVINNTGDTPTNGSLAVRFFVDDGTTTWTHVARRSVTIGPGNETTVDYRWPSPGRDIGQHNVTITILGAADPGVTATFEVAQTGVPAGSMFARALQHYWFFGLFLLSIVLFFAVLAARKS